MASKAKEVAVKEKEKERDEAPPIGAAETTDTLLPLLDLSDAAVKRLIRITKKRGCVTHDQVKLPHERQGMRGIAPVTGMARAIRAINDGLNEGICASPRKPLKDMTTRDALIEDMARTDDAAACLLSYDVDARGSAPRVPARTFERTAPVASESRRPQVPAAGNSTRHEPTAETAYQPAEYYDDAHAVADEVGAQCERYDEYDAHDYSGRDYEDSYQLRGRKLWAAVAILALAMIGTAGAYSYRTLFGGEAAAADGEDRLRDSKRRQADPGAPGRSQHGRARGLARRTIPDNQGSERMGARPRRQSAAGGDPPDGERSLSDRVRAMFATREPQASLRGSGR